MGNLPVGACLRNLCEVRRLVGSVGRGDDAGGTRGSWTHSTIAWNGSVLRLHGELDLATAARLEAEVLAQIEGHEELVVDLSELTFIDSTGIRTLIQIATAVAPKPVILRSPQPNVQHVFDLTGVDAIMDNLTIDRSI